jgi:4-amino-4-deoxy-L-arabinose transferase-like glycosyltransferase
MNKKIFSERFLLSIILILAFITRIYKIQIPLADHHSWRQSDTAAVARNFIKEGWHFLKPRIDNMAPLHPGKPNNERLFLVEPPIYNSLVAFVYKFFGLRESLARLVSIFFSLGSLIYLYLMAREYLGRRVAFLTAFFFALLPYSVFYSRVILPEPMMIFFSLGMMFWFAHWLEKANISHWSLVIGHSMVAFTQKSFPIFLIIPMAYLAWKRFGFNFKKYFVLLFYCFIVLLPFFAWRFYISQYSEGVPAYDWLFNQGGIRFRPAFFWWIFGERIGKLILGFWGLPLFVLGLILRPNKKEGLFFYAWLVAVLLYFIVFAAGNVTHDYYQISFVPIASIFLAKGADFLLRAPEIFFKKSIRYSLFAICSLFMVAFSWHEVRGFYNIQGGVDLAGRAVDQLTPKDALVLTGDSNDATLLYNCNRYGWTGGYASSFPNLPETIEKVRKMGGMVYVSTKFEEDSEFGQYMTQNYSVIERTNQYVIFSLIINH